MAAAGAARTLRRPSVIVSWNKYAETPASQTAALFCRCCDVLRFSNCQVSSKQQQAVIVWTDVSNACTCGAQQPSLRQRPRQHKLAWDDSTRYSGSRGGNDPRVPNNDVADFRGPQFSYRQFDLWGMDKVDERQHQQGRILGDNVLAASEAAPCAEQESLTTKTASVPRK